jgi:predicted Zn-dependent peptidase
VVGDFKPAEIKPLIAQYFGGIPRVEAPPPVACTTKFNQGAVVRRVTDKLANLPATLQFYRIPAHDHADTPALALLEIILGQGESSRLNVKLAREAQAAVSTQAGVFGTRRGPGVFATIAVANQGISADSLNTLLNAEVARIASEGVTDAELTKAKNVLTASVISDRQRALDIAEALQHAATFHGSLEAVNTDLTRYLAVTADDIKRVAQAYLRPDNALILLVSPGGAS